MDDKILRGNNDSGQIYDESIPIETNDGNFRSLLKFKSLTDSILDKHLKLENCSNTDTSPTTFQLSSAISISVFIIALHVTEKFFSTTLPLSIAFQKVDIDLSYCYECAADICQIFKDSR